MFKKHKERGLLILFGLLVFIFSDSINDTKAADPLTFESKRNWMVDAQIKARGINNEDILNTFRKVERHQFVPNNLKAYAYEDHPLPIGENQTISQPYIVALMTTVIEPNKTKRILEIGTGSGYQAAILAELCKTVYTIEIKSSLGNSAKKRLDEMRYKNIFVKIGDGYKGWPEYGPFDAIIVTCAPTHIPDPLKEQLSEGGKMVIPVGEKHVQKLVLLTKINGKLKEKEIIPVRFVPMIRKSGESY